MSIFHYFFGDDKKRANFIFNFIAPVYGLIDRAISDQYKKISRKLNEEITLQGLSVLDVGTGTGAWLSTLTEYTDGKATGTDFSLKMIKQARKNHPHTEFIHSDAEDLSAFDDNSYDIVTASFVLHGMKSAERIKVLKAMKRVSRRYVMIHDFRREQSLAVRILEALERSDYRNFKKQFDDEMKSVFGNLQIIEEDGGNAVYVGKI